MSKKNRIFVAGHKGMVGSALVRKLNQQKNVEIITKSRNELNLLDKNEVDSFFASESIDEVYL
ncbi:NAD-dependent epimerase/dehydratase family protein, partial [Escherichia coli]